MMGMPGTTSAGHAMDWYDQRCDQVEFRACTEAQPHIWLAVDRNRRVTRDEERRRFVMGTRWFSWFSIPERSYKRVRHMPADLRPRAYVKALDELRRGIVQIKAAYQSWDVHAVVERTVESLPHLHSIRAVLTLDRPSAQLPPVLEEFVLVAPGLSLREQTNDALRCLAWVHAVDTWLGAQHLCAGPPLRLWNMPQSLRPQPLAPDKQKQEAREILRLRRQDPHRLAQRAQRVLERVRARLGRESWQQRWVHRVDQETYLDPDLLARHDTSLRLRRDVHQLRTLRLALDSPAHQIPSRRSQIGHLNAFAPNQRRAWYNHLHITLFGQTGPYLCPWEPCPAPGVARSPPHD